MLGETPAQERARFANKLFAGPWTDSATRRHSGYALNRFRWLLDRMTPPPELPRIARRLETLTWHVWRCFTLLQEQRALTSTYVNVDDAATMNVPIVFPNPGPPGGGP